MTDRLRINYEMIGGVKRLIPPALPCLSNPVDIEEGDRWLKELDILEKNWKLAKDQLDEQTLNELKKDIQNYLGRVKNTIENVLKEIE